MEILLTNANDDDDDGEDDTEIEFLRNRVVYEIQTLANKAGRTGLVFRSLYLPTYLPTSLFFYLPTYLPPYLFYLDLPFFSF
jgi:hypothetical protein